jgi:hypothetical protein
MMVVEFPLISPIMGDLQQALIVPSHMPKHVAIFFMTIGAFTFKGTIANMG